MIGKHLLMAVACWGVSTVAIASNPLDFREYTQTLTLDFASAKEAEAAVLVPRALPAPYRMVISARWDDTNLNHLKTHKLMVKHGIKGTFFMNTPPKYLEAKAPEFSRQLMAGGNSIGVHTMTHPMLTMQNSNEHFREYMFNRIQWEIISQSPINAQVLPYCNWWAPNPMIPLSIGRGMRAAGIISSPDVFFPDRARELGYPEGSHATSRLLKPGDVNLDLKLLEQQLAAGLKDVNALAKQPSMSMSMHSSHTEEGLINLDKAFERLSKNPDWWYCNQNEYGAYRYETLNTRITKKMNGCKVIFSVTRMEPFELGASIPLSFELIGAKPLSVVGGTLEPGGAIVLPHATDHTLPVEFAKAEMPSAKLTLTHSAEKIWIARLENTGKTPLMNLDFTFRFPPAWEHAVIRADRESVAPGAVIEVQVEQPSCHNELFYRYGSPYYAVQLDFVRDSKRCRLYADLREPAPTGLPRTANQAAAIYEWNDKIDSAALSKPGTAPTSLGLQAVNLPLRHDTASGAINPLFNRQQWKDKKYIAVIDFEPLKSGNIELESQVDERWMDSKLYFNGLPVLFQNHRAVLTPVPGVNRMVLISPANRAQFLLLNGELEESVSFLPPVR